MESLFPILTGREFFLSLDRTEPVFDRTLRFADFFLLSIRFEFRFTEPSAELRRFTLDCLTFGCLWLPAFGFRLPALLVLSLLAKTPRAALSCDERQPLQKQAPNTIRANTARDKGTENRWVRRVTGSDHRLALRLHIVVV